jgi:flagellar protein FlaG
MMIERLGVTTAIPAQQRTTFNDGVNADPIKPVEKIQTNNHSEQQLLPQDDSKKKEKVEEVVKGLNNFLEPAHTSMRFKLHEKLNEYYAVIMDDKTNEVIKEIPAKKLLDMYAAMAEHLGLLVDKKI